MFVIKFAIKFVVYAFVALFTLMCLVALASF